MNQIRNSDRLTLERLIEYVQADENLDAQRKRNICSSIRKFSEVIGGSLSVTASFPVFRKLIDETNVSLLAMTAARWSNIRSDVSFSLKRYGAATRAPLREHLSPEWAKLRNLLDGNVRLRRGLSSFVHWCNATGVNPFEVDDKVFKRFLEHLTNETLKKNSRNTYQNACKLWNDAGCRYKTWPKNKVSVPHFKRQISFEWEDFPRSFVQDRDAYIRFMGTDDLANERCVSIPRQASTLEHHAKQIRRWASALVHDGFPIEELVNLSVLVRPENFRRAMRYYIEDWDGADAKPAGASGEHVKKPSHFEMAATIVVVAKEYVRVSEQDLEAIIDLRDRLKCRKRGFTRKNKARLRALLSVENQCRFLGLTDKLLKLAKGKDLTHRTALLMQKALVHELLIQAPMRFGNLVSLNQLRHIKRVKDGRNTRVFITIPEFEVKNGEALEFELPSSTVRLLDHYIETCRPLLLKGEDEGWLFPGNRAGEHKHEVTVRGQLCNIVKKHTNLEVNPHLYRHIAAFFYLQAQPGDYETVRRLLGHKSVDTTMTFYAEFDGLAARKLYSDHILDRKLDTMEKSIGKSW